MFPIQATSPGAGDGTPPIDVPGWTDELTPSDPRVAAFVRLTHALDGADPAEGVAATAELRRLGFHVVLARPDGRGMGSHAS